MNKDFLFYFLILILLSGCGGEKNPTPDNEIIGEKSIAQEISEFEPDSLKAVQSEQFFQLEESIADIQKEIENLRAQVMEYEYKTPETNYTKQLKELIDQPPPAHKISLKNGSIIEGTIEKDKVNYLMVKTKLGLLTINKTDIENIVDLILPIPDVVFIGHGQEEIFDSYRLFTGKVMNQGSRRGDFVRIIYNLWGEDTQLLNSDSTFIDGTHVIYHSGIVTDTVLEPNQSARYSVKIPVSDTISVAYVTREVRWELYD